jgi:hypothetical protein
LSYEGKERFAEMKKPAAKTPPKRKNAVMSKGKPKSAAVANKGSKKRKRLRKY